jgi:hypothetical protein
MSSPPPPPRIWFRLYNSATGEPYKEANADKVAVSSHADVADFRDAVIEKFEKQKSSVLSGFASFQLLVYKNKAAFDKRNATVDDGKEEPLKSSRSLDGLGTTEEEALIVVVPSLTSSPELIQLDRKIRELETSEEFKALADKNGVWAVPKATDQEKKEWQQLNEELAYLKRQRQDYVNLILSMNAHSVKKSDKIRKGYKKDTAIKDERLLLSDVAIKMWERFSFTLQRYGKPTFGDFQWAAGFKDDADVRDYFRKKAKEEVKEDEIKESLTESEWIWLIGLNQRVNPLLHDRLITNQDGSLRLVLEHEVYEDGAGVAEELVRKLYGPESKVDVKDAASDFTVR